MEQITLKTIYLAMTYVARSEGLELDKKYYEMEEWIHNNNDLDVVDMVDNIENVYKALEDKPFFITCSVCGENHEEQDVNCVDYEIDLCKTCEIRYLQQQDCQVCKGKGKLMLIPCTDESIQEREKEAIEIDCTFCQSTDVSKEGSEG